MPKKKVEARHGPYRYGFENPEDAAQTDYVPFGSEAHMRTANLRKATPEDEAVLVYKGFTFEDVTRYGSTATERFLRATLVQLVGSFMTAPLEPQSDDPNAPNYAQPMFLPVSRNEELVRGIV